MGPIGSLRGTLVERSPTGEVLVEVGGVGYRVQAGPLTAARLGDVGAEVFVWIHHHVREDAESLFGFASRDERTCFEALIGAHGVGPGAGPRHPLGPPARRAAAGPGRRRRRRAVPRARGREEDRGPPAGRAEVPARPARGRDGRRSSPNGNGASPASAARADVRDALVGLGYGAEEIGDAIRDLPDGDDSGVLLKEALRQLASAGR